jgi:hypothetical protein
MHLIFDRPQAHNDAATIGQRQDETVTHQPPSPATSPNPPRAGLHPLGKFVLFVPLIVLGYSALDGPIRWN